MIPFNKPPYTGNEDAHVLASMRSEKISGDGPYTHRCHKWFQDTLQCQKVLLTPSCTHALEMAAILIDTKPGDEIIMPSFTFVSSANPFVLRGAKIVFVDIRPDTMNIDETLIEAAITPKTKAIVPVHYAGVACEMDVIMQIANKYKLFVIEDAAQGVGSSYKGKPLGTFGQLSAFSFHETKNYTSGGEGGLLIINDPAFTQRAEIIREKGTNRSLFFRGMVDKYSWVDLGSSYLPADIQAAYLWGQLEEFEKIARARMAIWDQYNQGLEKLSHAGKLVLPTLPEQCQHNAHMFYVKCADISERTSLLGWLKTRGVHSVFHYIPLHSAIAGPGFSRFHGEDNFTTAESERLIRLPIWYGMSKDQVQQVIDAIAGFYL